MSASCYGAYENEGKCDACPLALMCIQATMANDGYYDELARREEEEWRSLQDALFQDAMAAWS